MHFKSRLEEWTSLTKQGNLPIRSVWISCTHQLWAGMKYGLGTPSASLLQLSKDLGSSEFYLISCIGIICLIKKTWGYLP